MKTKSSRTLKPVITLAELEASAEFRACTPKQQQWLRELAHGVSFTDATLNAFACATRRSARVRTVAVRKSPNAGAALALLLGKSEAEVVYETQRAQIAHLLREVNKNLRAAQPGSSAAQNLLAQKERLIRSLADGEIKTLKTTQPRFHLGEILTQNGTDYEVTGLEPNGDPITREIGPSHAV